METDRSPVIDENSSPMTDENPRLRDENLSTPTDEARFADEIPEEHPSLNARGRSFKRGKSGNPAGRPKGARNRTTLAAEALLDGQAEALTQKAIELALAGDPVALRLCLERVLPARRERRISFEMPPLESAEDAAPAMAAIVAAVAAGDITLSEAAQLGKLVETFVKAIEARDRDKHLKLLEWQQSNWEAKFQRSEPRDDEPPEELPLWTPRIGAIQKEWKKMPLKEEFRVIRCGRERRWDEIPEIFDPRTMTPSELQWFLDRDLFMEREPDPGTPLSHLSTEELLDFNERHTPEDEMEMTLDEIRAKWAKEDLEEEKRRNNHESPRGAPGR